MELLRNDDDFFLPENIPGPYNGIQGPKSCKIRINTVFGNAVFHQGELHVFRLVIVFPAVIAADDDVFDFAAFV